MVAGGAVMWRKPKCQFLQMKPLWKGYLLDGSNCDILEKLKPQREEKTGGLQMMGKREDS